MADNTQLFEIAGLDLVHPLPLIAAAERLHRDGDTPDAVHVASFAALIAPGDPQILRGASGVMAEARDYRRCDELMRRAVALSPDNAEYRLHRAVILIELHDYNAARAELDAHFRLEPASAPGWRILSTVFACQGDYARACDACDRALALDPANREYAIHRAGLLIVLERIADALRALAQLDADTPDDPVIARLFSAASEAAGDSDAAIAHARKACRLAPERLEYEQHLEHLETVRGTLSIARSGGAKGTGDLPQKAIGAGGSGRSWQALMTSGRVMISLLIREARTRYGGTHLGYVWAIFEPVSHLALLAVVFSFMHTSGGAPIGQSLLVYYFTGVLPYILFTNTIMHVQVGLEANRSLLQIPVIKPLDVLLARGVLELLTEVSVAVIMFTAFALYGLDAIPHDIVRCAEAVLAVWLLGLGFGVFNSVMLHFIKSWDHIFASLTRALYFISGIFFSPLTMPPSVLNVLAWNPLLQAIDLFRSGFYGFYQPYWLNGTYLFVCAFGIVTIGLGMERALRRRVSSPR